MEQAKIEELIAKYNEGLADPSEIKTIEHLIEEGRIQLTDLHELNKLDEQLVTIELPSPSIKLDDQFYTMLAAEKKKIQPATLKFSWPQWSVLFPRLAIAASFAIIGFIGGYWLQRPGANREVIALTNEIGALKEMVMFSLLEKESPTERLRAVSLASDMTQVSQDVTRALFRTLNEDENVNVRLAALEALKPYVRSSQVREELVRSIAKQDSPMVQLELATLMATIQEKKSVKELQRIVESDKTPKEVKNKIRESLKVLI